MSAFPEFNERGDLPVGIYKATLQEVVEHFGKGTLQRQVVTQRLKRVYELARSTKHLLRFIVYGSFVTNKSEPNDVDIFLVMDDDFDGNLFSVDVRKIFEHLETENTLGASIFWMLNKSVLVNEKVFIEGWQNRRDGMRRGIVEVIVYD